MIGKSLANLMRIAKEHNVMIYICFDDNLMAWKVALRKNDYTDTFVLLDAIEEDVLLLEEENNMIEKRFLDILDNLNAKYASVPGDDACVSCYNED